MNRENISTFNVLRARHPENEYVLIEEVSDRTGGRNRSLDFMIVNLWPSRGLAITGIERKSNRGDWLNELKNPLKQERHFVHCDYFYLLTDSEGVAKIEEIPETWGWHHINEKRVLKTLKVAPKLNPLPIERDLLCAMLRRAACKEGFIHKSELEATIQERAEGLAASKLRTLENNMESYRRLQERVDAFQKDSGISIRDHWNAGKIGNAVRLIMNGQIENYAQSLSRLEGQIKLLHENILKNISAVQELPTQVSTTPELITK